MWALEFVNSLGQYMNIFAMCSWYYTDKESLPDGSYGEKDVSKIDHPIPRALYTAIRFHLGTLFYGSAFMWIYRIPRIIDYTMGSFLDCCSCTKSCHDNLKKTWVDSEWTRIVYCDNVYRATHWDTAKERAKKVKESQEDVNRYMGTGIIVTYTGIIWVSTMGAGISWLMFTGIGSFTD